MYGSLSKTKRSAQRLAGLSGLTLATALAALPGGHAQAAPPTSGAIMQQTQPPAWEPALPPAVLALPAPQAQLSSSTIRIPVKRLAIDGNHLLPASALHALVQPAEGQSVTLGQLRAYVGRISTAYKQAGYPLAYAYLPAQQVHDGVIHISVIEPRYDQVQILGATRLRQDVARRTLGVAAGQTVAGAPLDRGLLLLDQTPGVQVNGVLVPGARPRTTNLQVNVKDTPLVSGDVYTNNFGNRYTGANLVGFDLGLNDPFGFGSAMAVNGMTAPTGHLQAAGFSIDSPYIWNGLRAGVYGSYTNYHLGGSFTDLLQRGRANQLGADLAWPLILRPGQALSVRLDLLQNWLGQTTLSTSTLAKQSITMERLTVSGVESDHFHGITSASLALTRGNVAVGAAQAKQADALTARTAGGFETALLQVVRHQTLPYGFMLTPSVTVQLASKNLDSSQQLYLGGPYGVMSYPSGEGGGDDGYLLDVRVSHALPVPPVIGGALQVTALAQTGTVWVNHNVFAGYVGSNRLTETGLGGELDYNWRNWHGQVGYVFQAGPTNPAGLATHGGQTWFQVTYSF